jgi:lysophospholipase L1-like esterase
MRSTLVWLVAAAACTPAGGAGPGPGDDQPAGDDVVDPAPDARPGDPASDAAPAPLLDDPALVIVVGDSLAAGYDAAGNNGPGGQGYARQVANDLPGVAFRDLAESGATSADAAARVRGAVGSLPAVDGDVLVLINVGGNDFNDEVAVMISPELTAQAAAELRGNLADIVGQLRGKYGDRAIFLIDDIHDPTDGTGSVPAGFDEGFCATLSNPVLQPAAGVALDNLATFNAAIAAEAAAQAAHLVPLHDHFLGHGMNAPAGQRWISDDCAHPTSEGHGRLADLVGSILE